MSLFSCILILVSVQLMYSWTSTSVLLDCSAVVVNQVKITIFQLCGHIAFHTIYAWLNCVVSRPVVQSMVQSTAEPSMTVTFDLMARIGISAWRDFLSAYFDLASPLCPVGSNIGGGYADNSLASMTLKSRDLLLINNPITPHRSLPDQSKECLQWGASFCVMYMFSFLCKFCCRMFRDTQFGMFAFDLFLFGELHQH